MNHYHLVVLLNKSKGMGSGWMVIATGWGFAVAIAVYVTGWVSGAHINPAVTLGFVCAGIFDISEAALYISAQMIGGFIGAVLVWLCYMPHWAETADADAARAPHAARAARAAAPPAAPPPAGRDRRRSRPCGARPAMREAALLRGAISD